MTTRRVVRGVLAAGSLLVASACGGGGDGDEIARATSTTSPIPGTSTTSGTTSGTTSRTTPEATSSEAGDSIAALASSAAFAGGNTDDSIAAAVDAFNDAGLDFSPSGLAERIPDGCDGIDLDALGAIIGVDIAVEPIETAFLRPEPGYLSCTLLADGSEVALAYLHLAPDLNGDVGWSVIGSLDGAVPIAGLGDAAVWSDGSGGSNQTNQTMLQVRVDQGGTQSLVQAQANEPQLERVGEWTVPDLILVLAAANATLTR